MEVKERVIDLLSKQLGYDKLELNENQNLQNDLDTDSLDMVEIVMAVEEEFGLHIEDDDIEGIKTVGDLIKKIEDMRMCR